MLEKTEENEAVELEISIPKDKVNVDNLTKLLKVKGDLIKKALGIDDLQIEVDDESVSFPWFSEIPDAESFAAYLHLITAMCQLSCEQTRINGSSKPVENERYAFRCFLLRLGFIGPEYKKQRKILLQNLSGSNAYKDRSRKRDGVFEA